MTLERIEWDAAICREYPASNEYYAAQVQLNRQRFDTLGPDALVHSKGVLPTGQE